MSHGSVERISLSWNEVMNFLNKVVTIVANYKKSSDPLCNWHGWVL